MRQRQIFSERDGRENSARFKRPLTFKLNKRVSL